MLQQEEERRERGGEGRGEGEGRERRDTYSPTPTDTPTDTQTYKHTHTDKQTKKQANTKLLKMTDQRLGKLSKLCVGDKVANELCKVDALVEHVGFCSRVRDISLLVQRLGRLQGVCR